MIKLAYITSSSYSGSTLLSFLLNTHPYIFTVGEMEGWNYHENEVFECSCGKILDDCPFFQTIADAFHKAQLPFNLRNFGTAYRVVRNDRLNCYLTRSLPHLVSNTFLEKFRDVIILNIPLFARLLKQQDKANLVFIRSALSYSGAKVFVDACKDPYRLYHMRRIGDVDIKIVYLIRDLRGVVLSNLDLKKPGQNPAMLTRQWIHQQLKILDILNDFPSYTKVYYEDLCNNVKDTLAAIYKSFGLSFHPPPNNFKSVEHHILGNVMRLSNVNKIVRNTRWERELSKQDLDSISNTALDFVHKNTRHPLSDIIRYYIQ